MPRWARYQPARLLAELTAAAEGARAELAARDELIVELAARGTSQRAIARAAGLSHPAVAKIVARQKGSSSS
jgi:DNA-binding NarL/FixJ family response regulator